jgi:hypothetical protein
MKDVDAECIHDMRSSALVLREAAAQLHEHHSTLQTADIDHLAEILTRRSNLLVRLLDDLTTSHQADRDALALSLQPVCLADLCRGVSRDRGSFAGTDITLQVSADMVVLADPMRVTQVMDNLVSNAIRYGGSHIRVRAERSGAHINLTVSDDGPGIPHELLDTLFKAYVHGPTSHALGGSGLGLAIVHELCQAMGATIAYDDADGTPTFTVTFPALPTTSAVLPREPADHSHSAVFWSSEEELVQRLVTYVAQGLANGEAVLLASTTPHRHLVESGLAAIGLDPTALKASGQFVPTDAAEVQGGLPRDDHIDRQRFDEVLGATVDLLGRRWRKFRVFGEIVDLYWRDHQDHLALDLEDCWNALRAKRPFPLLCGYETDPHRDHADIRRCHDDVEAA